MRKWRVSVAESGEWEHVARNGDTPIVCNFQNEGPERIQGGVNGASLAGDAAYNQSYAGQPGKGTYMVRR